MQKDTQNPVLKISNLSVAFQNIVQNNIDFSPVVNDISFDIDKKECLCLVGESGCGKSMTSLAIMGLTPFQAKVSAKEIFFDNQELTKLNNKEMSNIRGNTLAMIFQDPMSSLNPVLPIGEQVAEPLIKHKKLKKKEALLEAVALLEEVGIKNAKEKITVETKPYFNNFLHLSIWFLP